MWRGADLLVTLRAADEVAGDDAQPLNRIGSDFVTTFNLTLRVCSCQLRALRHH